MVMHLIKHIATVIQFVFFGTGGVLFFMGKNIALAGTALFWHHATFVEAAYAVGPFVAMLVGDGLWMVGVVVLRKKLPAAEAWIRSRVPAWGLAIAFTSVVADHQGGKERTTPFPLLAEWYRCLSAPVLMHFSLFAGTGHKSWSALL